MGTDGRFFVASWVMWLAELLLLRFSFAVPFPQSTTHIPKYSQSAANHKVPALSLKFLNLSNLAIFHDFSMETKETTSKSSQRCTFNPFWFFWQEFLQTCQNDPKLRRPPLSKFQPRKGLANTLSAWNEFVLFGICIQQVLNITRVSFEEFFMQNHDIPALQMYMHSSTLGHPGWFSISLTFIFHRLNLYGFPLREKFSTEFHGVPRNWWG